MLLTQYVEEQLFELSICHVPLRGSVAHYLVHYSASVNDCNRGWVRGKIQVTTITLAGLQSISLLCITYSVIKRQLVLSYHTHTVWEVKIP